MADNEGGKEQLKFADDESANDVFGEELWSEIKEVCGEAQRLLGDELPGGVGAGETQRVCIEIPKGLLLIARYTVACGDFHKDRSRMKYASSAVAADERKLDQQVRKLLAGRITQMLLQELHALAGGMHPLLREEAQRRGWRRETSQPEQ